MKIKIKYFAAMRELAGRSEEDFQTNAVSLEELYVELLQKYDFKLSIDEIKVAVNEQYCSFADKITENDTIVFIPPVAGG